MAEEWIVRVAEKDYGPVDLTRLREWKEEGRVLSSNHVRRVDADVWITAAEIPGLFPSTPSGAEAVAAATADRSPPDARPQVRRGFSDILAETWRIYRKGFWQFLCLTAVVAVPSICAQLTSAALGPSSNMEIDFRTLMAGAFNLCMLLLVLASWPVFIAGIQILTAELASGRTIGISEMFQRSLKFWPRIAFLCVVVYGVFFLLILFGFGILVLTALSAGSLVLMFLALALLAIQAWMFGRWFINVLFWQQFAVLDGSEPITALRQSKQLARSGRDLPWFRRPMWRGAFIASIWFAFVLAISIVSEWAVLRQYFDQLGTTQDPQALLQMLSTTSQAQGFNFIRLALNALETVLRPLLGIAFVILYFDSKIDDQTPG